MTLFKPGWQKGSHQERMAFVSRMTNQKKLAEAAEADDVYVCFAAAKRLADNALAQKAFAKAASCWFFDDTLGREALNYISKPQLLLEIIQTSGRYERIVTAIKRLTDQEALSVVAISGAGYEALAIKALIKITSQALLAKIAEESQFDMIRMQAAAALTDKTLAKKVYCMLQYSMNFMVKISAQQELAKLREMYG